MSSDPFHGRPNVDHPCCYRTELPSSQKFHIKKIIMLVGQKRELWLADKEECERPIKHSHNRTVGLMRSRVPEE